MLGPPKRAQRFVDVFCGTGAVSRAAADCGWRVLANDHLASAVTATSARLISRDQVLFAHFGCYEGAVEHLNCLRGRKDFFFREYSAAGENETGIRRPYFSEQNAQKIDAARFEVRRLVEKKALTRIEHVLLLADLMDAANQVANIAGTYGCFMKSLQQSAQRDYRVTTRILPAESKSWEVSNREAFDVQTTRNDVVYLDPPYTKRQYAAYYHILETLAKEDDPAVTGITGLRPWREKASAFCYKMRAASTLETLIATTSARRILISYSSDGHIDRTTLEAILSQYGDFTVHEFAEFVSVLPQ